MKLAPVSAVLLMLIAPAALALKADRQQPMDINADYTDALLADDGDAHLRGNVRISQGSLVINAADATVSRLQGAISRALLTGTPASIVQTLDSGGQMNASAARIDYNLADNVLELSGNVVVTQPEGELRGERIRYHVDSGKLEGGAPGSRVHLRLPPPNSGGAD